MTQIETWEDKLADLAVFGANVQPGQLVSVTSEIGKEEVTRKIARRAYERGAKYVDVLYFDRWIKRERIVHAVEDTLDYVPPWMRQRLLYLSDEHAARISLSGPHAPRALEGLDPARAGRDLLPYLPETGEVVNRMTTSWNIVPVPTRSWAELVYPELDRRGGVREAVGGRGAHLPPRDRRSVRRVDRALERAEGERAAPHGPPLRRAAPPRPGYRPHHRALPVGALGGGRPRDDRRSAPLAEHPDGRGLRNPRPRSRRRPRVGDDAARALGHDRPRDQSRVRRWARGEDRGGVRSRSTPLGRRSRRRSLTARRDRARRRRRAHRAARTECSTTR